MYFVVILINHVKFDVAGGGEKFQARLYETLTAIVVRVHRRGSLHCLWTLQNSIASANPQARKQGSVYIEITIG